jgi:2-iminobutanoate/2-iminopropanoate deaminase
VKSSATIKSIVLITTFLTSATVLAQQMKSAQAQSDPEFFPMPSIAGTPLPFSEAVRFGKTLYVSGQIGNLPGTLTLASGGIAAEARQALENIKSILERHDSSMDQVVKCTVFMADIKEWPAFNEVYREFFKAHYPARSALAASGLAFNARTEVECIAALP